MGENYEIAKIHIIFYRRTRPILTKLGTNHRYVNGIQVCSNKGLRTFPRGGNYVIAKIH